MDGPGHLTPYPDVDAAVHHLRSAAQAILGSGFRGMYLTGSLALGDFDPRSSDIDFVVVTAADVTADQLSALQAMHARFNASDSPWATEVEGIYIAWDALRRHDPARVWHPHIERGPRETLRMDHLDSGWVVQRHIVREKGIVIAGPPPRTLIDLVEPDDLRRAVALFMDVWWGPMVHDPWPLARPGYQAYAVLTMCRMLYTLEQGAVASKPAAARWARGQLGHRRAALIDRALAWRKDRPDTFGPDTGEAQRLIAHTVERFRLAGAADPISRPRRTTP